MSWFRIKKKPIISEQVQPPNMVPDGTWEKCPICNEIIYKKNFLKYLNVCQKCNYHFKLTASERIQITFDENSFKEFDKNIISADPLNFLDIEPYPKRLRESMEKTGIQEAIITGEGKIDGNSCAAGIMDFNFMGGSMGSVVGEKVTRLFEYATLMNLSAIIFSSSGGARMQEGILSLMQMAKTSAAIAKHSEKGLLYISICCNPTTGGTTASFAMLGDIIIGEPRALIGFAGPRVIEQTIRQKLPDKFQTSEFLLEKGFLDMVVSRKDLREILSKLLKSLGRNYGE